MKVVADKNFHLWSIDDAKDGDVLACENGWTCIFKCLNDNLFSSHCFIDHERWFCEDGGEAHTLDKRICGEIHPATKEQRETLMKAIADAGYKWDDEKKELIKIEEKSENYKQQVMSEMTDLAEDYIKQKPTWGEEDERYLNTTIAYLKDAKEFKKTAENCIDWLKSLKQRLGGRV